MIQHYRTDCKKIFRRGAYFCENFFRVITRVFIADNNIMKKLLVIIISVSVICAAAPTGDIDLLAGCIDGSGADDLLSMIAVGAAILNRVECSGLPDSVIQNAESLGIAPSPTPSPMAKFAAGLALSGVDPTSGAIHAYARGAEPDFADFTLVTRRFAFAR